MAKEDWGLLEARELEELKYRVSGIVKKVIVNSVRSSSEELMRIEHCKWKVLVHKNNFHQSAWVELDCGRLMSVMK